MHLEVLLKEREEWTPKFSSLQDSLTEAQEQLQKDKTQSNISIITLKKEIVEITDKLNSEKKITFEVLFPLLETQKSFFLIKSSPKIKINLNLINYKGFIKPTIFNFILFYFSYNFSQLRSLIEQKQGELEALRKTFESVQSRAEASRKEAESQLCEAQELTVKAQNILAEGRKTEAECEGKMEEVRVLKESLEREKRRLSEE